MLGIRIDHKGWESKPMYDADAIREMTGGPEGKEQMLDATQGLGPAHRDRDGRTYHQDVKTGEWSPLTEKQVNDVYLGGPVVDEIVGPS